MPNTDDKQDESRRILNQVDQTDGMGWLRNSARDTRTHLRGDDADPTDRIEVWGRRIGRGLSVVIVVLLIGWLASLLAAPA